LRNIESFASCDKKSDLPDKLEYTSENSVQNFVLSALSDMIKAGKLDMELSVLSELSIANVRPDIWVILGQNGRPMGVIEVKLPNIGAVTDLIILGQLFDYMLILREFYGVQNVFGICSTYEFYNICWLPDTDQSAASDKEVDASAKKLIGTSCTERVLHGTGPIHHSNELLPRVLVTVIRKMRYSPLLGAVPIMKVGKIAILMRSTDWEWVALDDPPVLTLVPPPRRTKMFYLLRDYHGGGDGHVWLGCSGAGNLVCLKFFANPMDATIEQKHWLQMGRKEVYVVTLMDTQVLVMPVGFTCHESSVTGQVYLRIAFCGHNSTDDTDNSTILLQKLLRDQLTACAKHANELTVQQIAVSAVAATAAAGLCHDDVRWRHVCVLPQFGATGKLLGVEPQFIDLLRMTQVKAKDAEAAHKMKTELNLS
jgi:hypothetical protein